MASENEKKAQQLMLDAEKKLKGQQGFFSSVFGGGVKFDEVCEIYTRAANTFKMAKNWGSAGNAFMQAAPLYMKSERPHDAATTYVDAGNCYKKIDPQEAINCIMKAVEIYTDMGKFTLAAKHHITIAEVYENEVADLGKAVEHYEKAADYFKGEEAATSANRCLLKVAQYAAILEKYDKAVEIYEQVGTESLNNSLLKHCAKEHFFKAGVCHLCVDVLNCQHALQRYEEMIPSFPDSRECKLLKQLSQCVEEQNVEGFTDAIKDYDSISRLDQWYTTLLLRVKKTISDEDLC